MSSSTRPVERTARTRCPNCGSTLNTKTLAGGTAQVWCSFVGGRSGFSGYREPPCAYGIDTPVIVSPTSSRIET